MHARGLPQYNVSPLIKYYMYGDIYSVSFRHFQPSMFLLRQKPKFIGKKSAFLRWLTLDERRSCQTSENISFENIWDIALQLGLIDIEYLYSRILSSGFKVQKKYVCKFYEIIGSPLLMPTSTTFRPEDIPVLVKYSIKKQRFNPLKDYIYNFYLVHVYLAQNLISNIQNQDQEGILNTLRVLEDSFGVSYQSAQVSAYLSFVRGDLDIAREHYRRYSQLKPIKNTYSLMPQSFLRAEAIDIGVKLDNLFGSF